MKSEKKQDKSYLLALALLLLSGFFVFLFLLPEKETKTDHFTQSKKFEESVNRHLFKTSQSIEMSRAKMQLETNNLVHGGVGPKAAPRPESNPLDLSTDPRAEALLKALNRDVRDSTGPANPDEQIQTELFESQQFQAYSEEYKKAYARQFVENARKAGYLIRLSEDYKVLSVQRIRKPAESFEMFQSHGGGVQ